MLSGSRPSSAVTLAVILAVTAGTSGCTGDSANDRRPAQALPPEVSVDWTQVPLPAAPGDRRVAVRDAAWCGDRWVVVGGLAGPGGVLTTVTHGAVSQLWGSVDGSTWSPVESPEAPVAVASSGTTVLVLVDAGDGGDGGQAWIARWPDLEAQ